MKKRTIADRPTLEQLENELERRKKKRRVLFPARPAAGMEPAKSKHTMSRPQTVRAQLEEEVFLKKRRRSFGRLLRNAAFILITVIAAAALLATLFMPILRIYGNSMEPAVSEGDIVVTVKTSHPEPGEVVAFYYNNRILVKRVIAGAGSMVDIDEAGNIYVDGELLIEPYIIEKSAGMSDLEYPVEVPDNQYFVLGDNRIVSADSRSSELGCISQDDILGRVVFRVWPLDSMRLIG